MVGSAHATGNQTEVRAGKGPGSARQPAPNIIAIGRIGARVIQPIAGIEILDSKFVKLTFQRVAEPLKNRFDQMLAPFNVT